MKTCVTLWSSSPWSKQDLARFPCNAIITSLYLTYPTAETVIRHADPETAIVLTTFNAATFAAGGSSLQTIRKLMALGFKLRMLNGLHAKLIVTESTILVGSQNLTAAGTRNHEATAQVSDPLEVARVRERLALWIAASQPITPEMVGHMESLVVARRKFATDFKALCADADAEIKKAQEKREHSLRIAEERRRAAADRARLRRSAAREEAASLRKAVENAFLLGSVPLWLERRDHLSFGPTHGQRYWTLLAPMGRDMTQWTLPGRGSPPLTKRERYLLVVPVTGRLGWLALQKTRLTGFRTRVVSKGQVVLDGVPFDVSVDTNQDSDTLATWNIEFSLGPNT